MLARHAVSYNTLQAAPDNREGSWPSMVCSDACKAVKCLMQWQWHQHAVCPSASQSVSERVVCCKQHKSINCHNRLHPGSCGIKSDCLLIHAGRTGATAGARPTHLLFNSIQGTTWEGRCVHTHLIHTSRLLHASGLYVSEGSSHDAASCERLSHSWQCAERQGCRATPAGLLPQSPQALVAWRPGRYMHCSTPRFAFQLPHSHAHTHTRAAASPLSLGRQCR